MILDSIPAIASLTVDQKLLLVWELWHDVSRDPVISAGVATLLDERIAEHGTNPETARTTDEVTTGIMELKRRIAARRP